MDNNSNSNINSNEEFKENGFIKTVLTTFFAVFVAELGDKTQIATFLLSAESGHPKIVFLAAALALTLTSFIGVLIGQIMSKYIKPVIFNNVAGCLMIIISLFIVFVDITDSQFTKYLPL